MKLSTEAILYLILNELLKLSTEDILYLILNELLKLSTEDILYLILNELLELSTEDILYLILNELLKVSTEDIFYLILNFFNLWLPKTLIPPKCVLTLITPIHKEGSKPKPANYRGISVMNSLLKILCMMNNRLMNYCETTKCQIGFRSKHRPTDLILRLKSVINKYVYEKKRKIYTRFIDFRKAFDSIWHEGLFSELQGNNINGNISQLMKTWD